MLAIKLVRKGKRNLPAFRVAVTDGKKVVEFLGAYYPHPKSPTFTVAADRVKYWIKSGAQPTSAVKDLIKGKYEFKPYVRKAAEEVKAEAAVPEAPAETSAAESAAVPAQEEPQPEQEAAAATPSPEEQEKPKEDA